MYEMHSFLDYQLTQILNSNKYMYGLKPRHDYQRYRPPKL